MILDTVDEKKKGVHTRYLILLIIFIVTAVNYADRATLSIAGTGNDSNLLIVFYVQIMPDDFVMQLHRF